MKILTPSANGSMQEFASPAKRSQSHLKVGIGHALSYCPIATFGNDCRYSPLCKTSMCIILLERYRGVSASTDILGVPKAHIFRKTKNKSSFYLSIFLQCLEWLVLCTCHQDSH